MPDHLAKVFMGSVSMKDPFHLKYFLETPKEIYIFWLPFCSTGGNQPVIHSFIPYRVIHSLLVTPFLYSENQIFSSFSIASLRFRIRTKTYTSKALYTMFVQGQSLATALSALAFLSHALPSTAASLGRPAHGIHHARSLRHANGPQPFGKRADAAGCAASAQSVEQFQNEYVAFHGWVNTWLQTAVQEDAATAVAQLKQEFSAYDSWINTWLDSALDTGAGPSVSASAPTHVSSVPFPTRTSIASSADLTVPVGTSSSFATVAPFPTASISQATGGSAGLLGTGSLGTGASAGLPRTRTHSSIVGEIASKSEDTSSKGTNTATVPSPPAPSASSSAARSSAAAPAASPAGSSPNTPANSGSFNAKAKDNVVVYYGQTAATSSVKLTDLCSDKDVNIVILSFLTTFAGPGGYPTVNFGAACSGAASPAAAAKGATGLLSCPDLGKDIQTCQRAGKKVFLSLGGAEASSAFTSDDQATKFATQLWNLFGAGTGEDAGLRPFGAGVSIDGFDIGKSLMVFVFYCHHLSSASRLLTSLSNYPFHHKNFELNSILPIRQREQRARPLRHFRNRPPRHLQSRLQEILLHLRRPPMPHPRRLHPPRRHEADGLRLGPILQQRQLQRRPARFRRLLQVLELPARRRTHAVHWCPGLRRHGLRWQRICSSRADWGGD